MSISDVSDRFGILEEIYTEERRQSVLSGTRTADAFARALIEKHGNIHLVEGELYAGAYPLSGDIEIVDRVKEEIGYGCTIFCGNQRIATNAIAAGGSGRALGTRTNEEVTEKVLHQGQIFLGVTHTIGKDWIIRYSPLKTEEGEIVGMIATYHEQTAFRKELSLFQSRIGEAADAARMVAEQATQLEKQNQQLERANRLRDEFLATMSHELRTPLNAILGYCESLGIGVYGRMEERQQAAIDSIERSGEHLLQLINDILDLSRIDSGEEDLHFDETDIRTLCEESLELVSEQAALKEVGVRHSIETKREKIIADPRRVKQILVNLLSNAMKFTEKGSIGLRVVDGANREEIAFIIEDTGIGIPPEYLDKIFDSFVQIDSGDTRRYQGTGLGLSLVKRLIEMHGGRIAVESTVGVGSQFTVTLPVRMDASPRSA